MEILLYSAMLYLLMIPISFVVITYFEDFFDASEVKEVLTCSFLWPIVLVFSLCKISENSFIEIHKRLPRRSKK